MIACNIFTVLVPNNKQRQAAGCLVCVQLIMCRPAELAERSTHHTGYDCCHLLLDRGRRGLKDTVSDKPDRYEAMSSERAELQTDDSYLTKVNCSHNNLPPIGGAVRVGRVCTSGSTLAAHLLPNSPFRPHPAYFYGAINSALWLFDAPR